MKWLGRPKTIEEVVATGLCSGCGVCAYVQPSDFLMVDVTDKGRRPQAQHIGAVNDTIAMSMCPGIGLTHDPSSFPEEVIPELRAGWGPIVRLWEGHATDKAIRFAGSSGGAASALASYALEKRGYSGVLHTAADEEFPVRNRTVVSSTRAELLSRTGSRYSPASPCEGLGIIEEGGGPFVFIGKPCDIAAANKARKLRPNLDKNLGLTIAFFCAGTPSTEGTLEMLRRMGINDPTQVRSLRYRGNGWPGRAIARLTKFDQEPIGNSLSYEESWGEVLSKHVQWRCRLCADHTGEFADIAVGDPWHREVSAGESGSSLILARSAIGERFVNACIEAGYLNATQCSAQTLPRSQHNLIKGRGALWGRTLGLRIIGAKAPVYSGFPMFKFWIFHLKLSEKITSVMGTVRRCLSRGYHPWWRL